MRKILLPLLYCVTLCLSALLLFWIQPLVAKRLLPLLGGTPMVWNTCLLFFQTLLLAGYAYVLFVTRRFALRGQILFHLTLLAIAFSFLPGAAQSLTIADFDFTRNPTWWLLTTLLASVGLPFFVLSASAPLLQRWFAETSHTQARDPYFLYAASNAGSLLALMLFPFLFEPLFDIHRQFTLWTYGYVALASLIALCGWVSWRAKVAPFSQNEIHDEQTSEPLSTLSWARRLHWLALAFVPSSLVLGITNYLTTDIAAVPLLWTLPLAIYLLTFVLAFARRQLVSIGMLARIAAGAAVLVTLVLLSGATEPVWFLVAVHLAFFFFAALTLHTRLAALRPASARLAEYYLWLAIGGALGGFFNALIAPLIFTTTLEYPLAIIFACLLLPLRMMRHEPDNLRITDDAQDEQEDATASGLWSKLQRETRARNLAWAALPGALTAVLAIVVTQVELGTLERIAIALGVPLFLLNHFYTKAAAPFALGLGGIMLASTLLMLEAGTMIHHERNFYGTLRIARDPDTNAHKLYHGSTLHGRQLTDEARRCEPLSYYTREGPLGSVFAAFDAKNISNARVAVVGLGTGATVAYTRANQAWTFYELNPAVARLAKDNRFFSYLHACAATPVNIVLGDARLRLAEAPDAGYDLIVLDAFSSDAVPVHLLTREAMRLYLAKLKPTGWLALHVSNRSLNLHAIVARLADDAGLQAFNFDDARFDRERGREPSQWIVVASRTADTAALQDDKRWRALPHDGRAALWRDDFSSIVSVFKLFR